MGASVRLVGTGVACVAGSLVWLFGPLVLLGVGVVLVAGGLLIDFEE